MEGRIAAAAKPAIIKVAALCGELRENSCNRGLIRSAIQLSKDSIKGMQIDYVDIEPLPFVNTDLEVNGTFPPVVEVFRRKILDADSILFATPYLKPFPAPLKNAFDWACRPPNVCGDRPTAVFSAGEPHDLYFDSDGNLINQESVENLRQSLLSFQAYTLRLKG